MATLKAIRGDDFRATFIWNDPEGEPIVITNYDATFTISIPGDTDLVLEVDDGITLTGTEGKLEIHVEDTVTADWGPPGTYRLRVESPAGEVTTLAVGILKVE